jgi:hypothetical protein
MDAQPNDPRRQLAAAWQAATAAMGEWRRQIAVATNDAVDKLDPAFRAAVAAARAAVTGDWRSCRCPCGTAHPEDPGVCDGKAVLTRQAGESDVSMCAPCAVAQGVAEFPRGLRHYGITALRLPPDAAPQAGFFSRSVRLALTRASPRLNAGNRRSMTARWRRSPGRTARAWPGARMIS